MNIKIFGMGQKGYAVITAVAEALNGNDYLSVVIGQDKNVLDDYSDIIRIFCEENRVVYEMANQIDMASEAVDLVFAAGWRWMIRDVPENKLIIFHDSLLPKYRGFSPLVNALLNREAEVGVTALFGGEKFDTGRIIAQQRNAIVYPTKISVEIERMACLYSVLAKEVYSQISSTGRMPTGVEQDNKDASYSLWRDEEDYRIDWSLSAVDISHFISCVGYPFLGASTLLDGAKYRILSAELVDDVQIENRSPGKVLFIEKGFPVVVCGKGLLRLLVVSDEEDMSALPWKRIRSRFT